MSDDNTQTGVDEGVPDLSETPELEMVETELGSPPDETTEELHKSADDYEAEKDGLLKDLYGKREALRQKDQQIYMMQQQMMQNQAPAQQQEVGFEDEEYPTAAEIKKMVNTTVQQKLGQGLSHGYNSLMAMSEKAARERHSDYDEVMAHFQSALQRNPGIANAVRESFDPAEEAYNIGTGQPEYRQKVSTKQTKKVLAKKQANGKTVPTLSDTGASGTGTADAVKRVKDMSFDDVNAEIERIISGE